MNKNYVRIGIGSFLGIILLTLAVLTVPNASELIWVAYGWSVLALIFFAVSLGYWASGEKIKYILNAAYPLVVRGYLFITLLIAVVFSVLSMLDIWTMPWLVFCLIEFVVLVIAAWKILAMRAGEEAIMETEEAVKISTISWKMLVTDIIAIAERTAAEDKKSVDRTMEAIRYADPVEHPAVAPVVENIAAKVAELSAAVDAGDSAKIAENCTVIERLVKERANKLMILK